jgi:hypothetical protein
MPMTITDPYRSVTASKDTVTTPACKRRMTADATTPIGNAALLQSAEQIRNDLRNSLVQVNDLIREVKVQRRQDRLLQSTMDSLRKLSLA